MIVLEYDVGALMRLARVIEKGWGGRLMVQEQITFSTIKLAPQ